jgi:hypothetical protein
VREPGPGCDRINVTVGTGAPERPALATPRRLGRNLRS